MILRVKCPFINNKLGIQLESQKQVVQDSRSAINFRCNLNYKSKHLRFLVFKLTNLLVEDKKH